MFPRQSRLTRTKDIERVFKRGRHAYSSQLYVNILPNSTDASRYAVIVGNKSGLKAAGRNLLKRRIREAMIVLAGSGEWQQLGPVDCVIGAKGRFEAVPKYSQIVEWLNQCLKRLPYSSSGGTRKPSPPTTAH
jgi:ribonuclease P protein component